MNTPNQSSCSLCTGQGCVARFLGMKQAEGKPIPGRVMVVLYGVPLLFLFTGSLLGALMGEVESIFGAATGLLFSFFALRACQRFLNRLSL